MLYGMFYMLVNAHTDACKTYRTVYSCLPEDELYFIHSIQYYN
jgi:hypothetical protein